MSKQRRTVSLDEDADRYLDRADVNASGFVNRLVRNAINTDGKDLSMLRLRKQQLESDIESLEGELKNKRQEKERVEEQLDEQQNQTATTIEEAVTHLDGIPADPDNPAIQNWADKANLPVETFVDELEACR